MPKTFLEWTELLSIVTIVGLPLAIYVFMVERRKERQAEEEAIHQRLSDEYNSFLKLVIDNADLQLLSREGVHTELSAEQRERKNAIFGILVPLFERTYIHVYEDTWTGNAAACGKAVRTTCATGASAATSARPCLTCSMANTRTSRVTSFGSPAWKRSEPLCERE